MKFEIAPKETETQANWDDARLYCFALNIDEKVGWRLPTIKELNYINRVINDLSTEDYWSSIERPDKRYAECYTTIDGGYTVNTLKHDLGYVSAVRDLV
jgi:hypothetical protein